MLFQDFFLIAMRLPLGGGRQPLSRENQKKAPRISEALFAKNEIYAKNFRSITGNSTRPDIRAAHSEDVIAVTGAIPGEIDIRRRIETANPGEVTRVGRIATTIRACRVNSKATTTVVVFPATDVLRRVGRASRIWNCAISVIAVARSEVNNTLLTMSFMFHLLCV
jgi:hypothetical protein